MNSDRISRLAELIRQRQDGHEGRFLVAIAGPPASGKSTLAADLVAALGPGAALMPMDGFHLDDAVLQARGHHARKGAPHTFDSAGLTHSLQRIRQGQEVAIPLFDRARELARAGAAIIELDHRIIVVEGNYLLLDQAPWSELRALFDLTILLREEESLLVQRLLDRWRLYGKADARAWIEGNDLPNIRLVQEHSTHADLILSQTGTGATTWTPGP